MKAIFDTEPIILTQRYLKAIVEIMRAEIDMMQGQTDFGNPDWWYWGRCYIHDLASRNLEFIYGGAEDLPGDGYGKFAILVDSPDAKFPGLIYLDGGVEVYEEKE